MHDLMFFVVLNSICLLLGESAQDWHDICRVKLRSVSDPLGAGQLAGLMIHERSLPRELSLQKPKPEQSKNAEHSMHI